MQCDLCGKETDVLYEIVIEGTRLNVCKDCSSFGKVVRVKKVSDKEGLKKEEKSKGLRTKHHEEKPEKIFVLIPNFGSVIKKKRESIGLKQEQFAKVLSIKESLLHKIETSSFEPPLDLARKLEKLLNIKLVEEVSDEPLSNVKTTKKTLTLGDLMKIRKRKKD